MKPYVISKNPLFVGRHQELERLARIHNGGQAAMIVVMGRRRVGKTELIEQFFRQSPVLKFEGVQPSLRVSNERHQQKQRELCAFRLHTYGIEAPATFDSWTEFFHAISPIVETREIVLYFEELQWMAGYDNSFLAEMKPFWDDMWRHNERLRIVFSGSSPSFLTTQFSAESAFYNRSNHQITLDALSPKECKEFLNSRGLREVLLLSLCVGGIPGYLERFKFEESVIQILREEISYPDGFFSREYERIFVSSLAHSRYYRAILEKLGEQRFLTRSELCAKIETTTRAGGEFSKVLNDLAKCQFIDDYAPVYLNQGRNLRRYRIADEYLHFYLQIVKPLERQGGGKKNSVQFGAREFSSFLGISFERWCLKHEQLIAKFIGFSDVEYSVGSFFSRKSEDVQRGFQIDLMFVRKDSTIIVCECKYAEAVLPTTISQEVNAKIALLCTVKPEYKHFTIRKYLITTDLTFAPNSVRDGFDDTISVYSLFDI